MKFIDEKFITTPNRGDFIIKYDPEPKRIRDYNSSTSKFMEGWDISKSNITIEPTDPNKEVAEIDVRYYDYESYRTERKIIKTGNEINTWGMGDNFEIKNIYVELKDKPKEPKDLLQITDLLKQAKDDDIEITTDPPAFEKQEFTDVGGMVQQVTNTYINRGDKLIFKFKEGVNKKFTELNIEYSWQYKWYELSNLNDTEITINTQDVGTDRDYEETEDGDFKLVLKSYEITTKDTTPPKPEPDPDPDPDPEPEPDPDPEPEPEPDPEPDPEPEPDPDPEPEPENSEKNYLNIYKINNDIYYRLMGHMTIDDALTPIDNSYISNLYTIPFNIDNIVQSEKTPIVYGKNKSKVEAYPISKDKIRVELGQIKIPSKYNNAYDYINTTTVLYCPLIKPVELNYKYCINQTLTLFYEIDLATARTDLVIKSSLVNNEVFYIEEVETLTPIEFISEKKDNNIKEKNRATIKNYISTPQIQVIRNTPYINNDNDYVSNFRGWEFAIFKDLSGYVEIEEIDLNFKCLKREADILKSILKSGIIKD